MIEWRDTAILLTARVHGENAVIIEVLTPHHGKQAGVVRGGTSRKMSPVLQPGAQLDVAWKARLEEHLGSFTVEPIRSRSVAAMGDRLSLAGMNAVCTLLARVLPDREIHAPLFHRTEALLDLLGQSDIWPLAYLQWEMALLAELGFALDLSVCAVNGVTDDLIYISPKSGRAVSRSGAGEWADRMLALWPVMRGEGDASGAEIADALGTTGYFIEHKLFKSLGDGSPPAARDRLIEAIRKFG